MKSNENIDVIICSDLEHENLLAEITIDSKFIGLVTDEPNKGLCFEIPHGQLSFNCVSLSAFEKALVEAKRKLKAMGPINNGDN